MKTILRNSLILILPLIALSCKDRIVETYIVNEPIYLSYEDLRSPVETKSAVEIVQPGKIYFKDNLIFINEYMKGVHIINNQDPETPVSVCFIEVPGNVDMAIKGDVLYVDSYVDLIAIDISDLNNIQEVNRIEDAFPYIMPAFEDGVSGDVNSNLGVVTGWHKVEKTVEVTSNNTYPKYYPMYEMDGMAALNVGAPTVSGDGSGIDGSMARFTLFNNYLYTVDNSILRLFDVSAASTPVFKKEIYIGWNIETIFPYDSKLFIGSQTGMLIYNLQDPSNPEYISEFRHASSCDPVIVEGDYAYVTLRAGNLCGNTESQLDVIDISDINSPKLIEEYAMTEPYGLGIDDTVLFVCDGSAGLKIFNASDPLAIDQNLLVTYNEVNAFDVIPLGEILLVITADGLYQYNYSDLTNIEQLSFIPINRK